MNQYDQFIDTLLKQIQSNGSGWGYTLDPDQEDKESPQVCTSEEWEEFAKQYGLEDGEVRVEL